MKYKNTLPVIMDILELFKNQNSSYILFKCDHIFQGKNKNVDILFETDNDYYLARQILQKEGFVCRLSEKIEKYKSMYTGLYKDSICSIHLHREIAWHGIKALDKKPVFARKRQINAVIIVPGMEDSILIHAAHVLFENFVITEKERKYFQVISSPGLDLKYMNHQVKKNKWKNGFWNVVHSTQNKISPIIIARTWAGKVMQEPYTFSYLVEKIIKKIVRKKSGFLISFIGVNGSGKTTLSRKVLENFEPITKHLGKKQHYYYFGWNPEFFITKMISTLFQKRNKQLFKKINLQKKIKRFDLFQEILFLYIFVEFYYRYWKNIKPKLKRNELVITDRYFYDIYGQYPYARNSIILPLLLKLFPKPDCTYLLDVSSEILRTREKVNKDKKDGIEYVKRFVLPLHYLLQQKENYHALARLQRLKILDTTSHSAKTAEKIVMETWKKII